MALHHLDRRYWRYSYNPIRGLSLARIASMLELSQQGYYADLTWFYSFIERREPYLRAVKLRRKAALVKLDWSVKTIEAAKRDPDLAALAEEQAAFLKAQYERIQNLKASLGFLASAEFRGFAHLEKIYDELGNVVRFEKVEQWFWARAMPDTQWLYNAPANQVNKGVPIERSDFLVREVELSVDEAICVAYFRRNMGKKDWDAMLESWGIPNVFMVLPTGASEAQRAQFQTIAEDAIADGRGTLPTGTVVNVTSGHAEKSTMPFKEYNDELKEEIILSGTGGKLTMLNDPTGLGSGQSEVHSETFDELAKAEAQEINEVMQSDFDRIELAMAFPGQPVLVYFALASNEETDTGEYVEQVTRLAAAGYETDAAEVSEKTGSRITKRPRGPAGFGALPAPGSNGNGAAVDDPRELLRYPPGSRSILAAREAFVQGRETATTGSATGVTADVTLANRKPDIVNEPLEEAAQKALAKALARDLNAVRNRLRRIAAIEDPEVRDQKLRDLKAELPKLLRAINADPSTERVFEESMVAALFNGVGA